jgi:hypothetical protein
MVDFGEKGYNRWLEGIIRGKPDRESEYPARIGRIIWTEDHGLPIEEVGL